MTDFTEPKREILHVKDIIGDLIDADFIKDLCEDEAICPVCHGLGFYGITDNAFGVSDVSNKKRHFPYKHQTFARCKNCFNGVVHICPDCGKQIPRSQIYCDCEATQQRLKEKREREEAERFEAAEKFEPVALGAKFKMAQSPYYHYDKGYFDNWEDFFDFWNENPDKPKIASTYVWGTYEGHMTLSAHEIVDTECCDLYDGAYDDIGDAAIQEMQNYLDEWKAKYGRTAYFPNTRCAIRIPWEKYGGTDESIKQL